MKNRRYMALAVALTLVAITGCQAKQQESQTTEKELVTELAQGTEPAVLGGLAPTAAADNETDAPVEKADPVLYTVMDGVEVKKSSFDQQTAFSLKRDTVIMMDEDSVDVVGEGVNVSGRKIIIQAAGTYILQGNLPNGQIYIQVAEDEKVQLVLDDVVIGCEFSAPIYCEQADKLVITLAEGTTNLVTDYLSGTDDSAKACIYAKCDLTVNGAGNLTVNGAFRHGIVSDKDLKIVDGVIEVNAAENGLRGKKSVLIFGGEIQVTAGEDAIKASKNETGMIFVTEAQLSLTAEDDGLQADQCIILRDADVKVRCFGDVTKCDGVTEGTEQIVRWN